MVMNNPDIRTNWNNGVQIFVPTRDGQLAHLVCETIDGDIQGWAFGDFNPNPDRPVFSGSIADAETFERTCEKYGLVIRHDTSLHVPFSNGPRRRGEHTGSYLPSEYAAVCVDLTLAEVLANP